MFTDSHCHLTFAPLKRDINAIRLAMEQAHVTRALCVCTTLEEFDEVYEMASAYDNFWASVGVHPENEGVAEPSIQDLLRRSQRSKVVAIGETGLDYYDMTGRKGGRSIADLDWQRERFHVHIQAARQCDLPLIIHTRSASEDTLAILREEGGFGSSSPSIRSSDEGGISRAKGVFHCFTESMAVAKAALDMDFYISFSGILTFKAAAALREVAAYVPLERCLIETDSPYLAPAPHRGKTNQPSFVSLVAEQLAQIKGISIEQAAQATSANFDQLFKRTASSGGI